MLTNKQRRELDTVARYLKVARKDHLEYPCRHDLIGRALREQVEHFERMLVEIRQKFGL